MRPWVGPPEPQGNRDGERKGGEEREGAGKGGKGRGRIGKRGEARGEEGKGWRGGERRGGEGRGGEGGERTGRKYALFTYISMDLASVHVYKYHGPED